MNSYLKGSKYKSSLRSSAMEFVPQSSSHQFNHPQKGVSKTTLSMETCPKDSSHQFNHPPKGVSKTTVSMETCPKDSSYQFNHLPKASSKAMMSMGARCKDTSLHQDGTKEHALHYKTSMPPKSQQTNNTTYHTQETAMVSTQESIQRDVLVQNNVEQESQNLLTIMQRQNDITALLVQQQSSLSLPPRDIPTFDGDPLEYSTFIRAFENGVERKTASSIDCLYFLEQYTKGQPKELVKSCQHMPPERGYQRAKSNVLEMNKV